MQTYLSARKKERETGRVYVHGERETVRVCEIVLMKWLVTIYIYCEVIKPRAERE